MNKKRENISVRDMFTEQTLIDSSVEEESYDGEVWYNTYAEQLHHFNDSFELILNFIDSTDLDNETEYITAIVRRKSDSRYFKFEFVSCHYNGSSNILSRTATEVFPKQVVSIIYE